MSKVIQLRPTAPMDTDEIVKSAKELLRDVPLTRDQYAELTELLVECRMIEMGSKKVGRK